MQNQIRQLEDGTFEIGTWIQNANGEVVFFLSENPRQGTIRNNSQRIIGRHGIF